MDSLLGATLGWVNVKAVTDACPHGLSARHSDIHSSQMDTMRTRLAADSMCSRAVIGATQRRAHTAQPQLLRARLCSRSMSR
mgnify:CR=1 FL=1